MKKALEVLMSLKVGRKFLAMIVGLVLASLKAAHPDWPLPSEELVLDLVLAFMACHSVTDIFAIMKTGGKELVKELGPKL